ncbi:hypothetical protein TrispH2_012043 [Trichoplax sp. H2]|nr:hypothetical protein TrispH2_012043 [Trichoplax sp. H2]|eukprot:RDD35969.1 hypothetical protein TrispH2_012043 [Trichoplax sp. H2]
MEFGSDLFSKPDSCQNFIEIYGGDMTASNLVSKKCNSKTGSSVSMNGTTAIVHYKIKNYNTKKNFRLVYQGVTTGVLHKEIIFKNATCEAIEWYYNTPFGKVISRTSFSCSSGHGIKGTLPLWAFVLIIIGSCAVLIGLSIGVGCCIYKAVKRRRSTPYRQI